MEAKFWQYYLSLEEDIDRLFRYIEPSVDNYCTYSVELTRLYLAICSELDVIFKAYCKLLESDTKALRITDYTKIISNSNRGLCKESVTLERFGVSITPFSDWEQLSTPDWWKKHNGVKHNRDINFRDANMGNVLNAFGALYLINLNYYHALRSEEHRKHGVFESPEETALSLRSKLNVFRTNSLWHGVY